MSSSLHRDCDQFLQLILATMENAPQENPKPNGDSEMTDIHDETYRHTHGDESKHQQPPLGRNASKGDSQPILAERQVSVGVISEAATAVPATTPAPTEAATQVNGDMVSVKSTEPSLPALDGSVECKHPDRTNPPTPIHAHTSVSAGAAAATHMNASASPVPRFGAATMAHQQIQLVPSTTTTTTANVTISNHSPTMPMAVAQPPRYFGESTPAVPLMAQRPPGPPGLGLSFPATSAGTAPASSANVHSPVPRTVAPLSTSMPMTMSMQMQMPTSMPPEPVHPPSSSSSLARPPPPAISQAAPSANVVRPVPGMRELRVEDALLYLDDVKREFGDRPRVYNEFLAIMKNFKSQEVDTPGVIARVSKLFRGYNNLILGFNKFLPDGYKISLADLQEADARYAREQEELKRQAAAVGEPMPPVQPPAAVASAMPPAASFPSQPPRALGPPGLPPPVAVRPAMQTSLEAMRRSPVEENRPRAPPGLTPPTVAGPAPFPQKKSPQGPRPANARPVPAPISASVSMPVPAAATSGPPPQQAVEFDHAISYVTTIKRRFADDPSTYHSFLEILHTYQKEQRGIKEVLEQVAHLFQDHPDLLKEFTFFLPDAVQEQAKERLHRAAADSEARIAAQRAQLEQQKHEDPEDMDIDQNGKHRLIDMTGQPIPEPEQSRGRKRSLKEPAVEPAPQTIVLPKQPEMYVYNSAVERQFFDTTREALAAYTRDGGQAWAEFLKCLDMYAQEILSRTEMFDFVEPLLGKRNNKLYEEFKRIIHSAGAQATNAPNIEDSWYSVPLSEIDFTRCRRCSPSYRALPRDYPSPPCSDRTEEEGKVLNDIWVSLPVGSEESYTFRHMRRNTYEEILFRCEDERFEIDMAIDSNATTLARLEPIAEEIAQLAENELILPETSSTPKPASADQGMGGKRFHYTFDKTILSVIHRNSIARIYGDAGQEMLDLIVKNPTVAVPVVVERLRQKDMEWKKVRARLNRRWKELAEHNYYRSLDHRSLTWRTTDKRAISTRTLVSEIKDRAANSGNESSAAFQVRLDKAKEEHGAFYEVTKGAMLKKKLDLTNLPKPDRRLFTPHLSLMYENTGWAHHDAYRILSFALERGSISPSDKERCHRLWFDFLGPWFDLSMDWMMGPAVKFQETTNPVTSIALPRIVSNGDESMADDDDEESPDEDGAIPARVVTEDVRQMKHNDKHNTPSYMDHHPLPAGATVSTLYGDGQIIKCRRSDDTYVVQLPFGIAFLRPSAVLCSIIPAEKSAYTSQLCADDHTKLERPSDMLAVGTQSLYLFFRLHQILVRRLGIARDLAYSIKEDPTLINMVEQMPGDDAAALGRRRYDAYFSLVFSLLDGGHTLSGSAAEGGKYEDRVRALLGHGSYELATMDKLISHILKNLQSMANDDTMWNLVQLYRRHLASGSFKPEAFRVEAGFLSEGEPMYAFQMCPVQRDKGDKSVLHMEYMGVISDNKKTAVIDDNPTNDGVVDSHSAKRHKRDR